MTKGQSQFARLSELREKQETQEAATEAPPASRKKADSPKREKPTPVIAQPLPELELPDLPEPAAQQQAVTRLLSAQVPQERKLAFDQRVLEARHYYPDLEMREGVIALLSMLDDERIYRMWLHEIGKLKD